jgi:predicted N-acyltransferase
MAVCGGAECRGQRRPHIELRKARQTTTAKLSHSCRPALTTLRILDSLHDIDPAHWNALGGGHPLVSHAFLHALHETGCAAEKTGWTPQYLAAEKAGFLQGAMPLYVKTHSRGEYVFDWAWADAYQRHGLDYYPKLLCAIPFTPCTTPRLLAQDDATRALLIEGALELAASSPVSSLHVLFPPDHETEMLRAAGMMPRKTVQFHWSNRGYADFDAFLATMSHDKRKKIRQERRKVRDAGVVYRHIEGAAITPELWRFWTHCYTHTYRAHGSPPYLSLAFFEQLGRTMPQHLLLVVGAVGSENVCASLCIHDGETLYGRYWGAIGYLPGLHFETCYYQPLEFCIARGIATFEGGAQGEHKLARGFLPVETSSLHWLKQAQFADAVENFLERESAGIHRYVDELNEHSPFKAGAAD